MIPRDTAVSNEPKVVQYQKKLTVQLASTFYRKKMYTVLPGYIMTPEKALAYLKCSG